MLTIGRWIVFAVATTVVGLALAFGLLMLSRLYAALQEPIFTLSALVLYSIGVTLAAINYGAKLEDADAEGEPAPTSSDPRRFDL